MPITIAVIGASHTGKSSLAEPILGQMEFYGYDPIFIDDCRPLFYQKNREQLSNKEILAILEKQIFFEKQGQNNAKTEVIIISYPAVCAYAWALSRFSNANQTDYARLRILGKEALDLAIRYDYFLHIEATYEYLVWKQKKLKKRNSTFRLNFEDIFHEEKILSILIKKGRIKQNKGYFLISETSDKDRYPNRRFARAIEILKNEFNRLGPMTPEDIAKIAPFVAKKMKHQTDEEPSFAELFGIN